MVYALFATCTPLFFGLYVGNILPFILVALLGHFLFVLDGPLPIKQRIALMLTNGLLFMGSILIGVYSRQWPMTFILLFSLGVYAMGLSVNLSKALEMTILFILVNITIGHYATFIAEEAFYKIITYDFYYLLPMTIFATFIHLYNRSKHKGQDVNPTSLPTQLPTSSPRTFHLYSLSFAIATMIGFLFCNAYQVQKPYWVIITLMVIFKPEKKISLYRLMQRFMGTVLGVIAASILFQWHFTTPNLLILVSLVSFLLPYGMNKNYWMGTFFITLLVIGLLSIASAGKAALSLTEERFLATLYGCILAGLGTALFEIFLFIARKRDQKKKGQNPLT